MKDAKFRKIMAYDIFTEIMNGTRVMCLDRARCDVYSLNPIGIAKVANIIKAAKESYDFQTYSNYEFWAVEITEGEEDGTDTV